jgi:hypothetical protein
LILLDQKSVITDGNAANKPTKFYHSLNDLDKLPWDVLNAERWSNFEDTDEKKKEDRRKRSAEILIYPDVPAEYIDKIYYNSVQTEKALAHLNREVILDKKKFFGMMNDN